MAESRRSLWEDGNTYVVDTDLTINHVSISGAKVTLILNEGRRLTVDGYIQVDSGQSLTISPGGTGGTVYATGDSGGAGIGSTYSLDSRCIIVISGGTVTARGGAVGIGGLDRAMDKGTLSSGTNGSAWVVASSVNADKVGFKSGVLIEGSRGNVYGEPEIRTDAEVPSGATLTIPSGSWLQVAKGAAVTNNGTIDNTGTIIGEITNKMGIGVSPSSMGKGGKIVNDGFVKLPTGEDIKSLKMTGRGAVEVDGEIYDNDGTLKEPPTPDPTPDPEPTPVPNLHDGDIDPAKTDSLWSARAGDDMTIYIDVDFDQFTGSVSLDGVPLTMDTTVSHDFGARAGSTVVTIWEKTLKEKITTDGKHSAEVGFTDGTAVHTFTASGTGETPPQRQSTSGGGCATLSGALVALVGLAAIKRRAK